MEAQFGDCRPFCSTVLCGAIIILIASAAAAQTGQDTAAEQKQSGVAVEFAEAASVLKGRAGSPECVWVGRRAVNLLWRQDPYRGYLDLYDRFGCPQHHIEIAFRCMIRQGGIGPKVADNVGQLVHACWIDPNRHARLLPPG